MASARAAALRQSPTYAPPAPVQQSDIPKVDTSGFAKLPTLPTLDTGRLPDGGYGLKGIQDQITNLPGQFNPLLTQAQSQAKQGLAGLGGWRFKQDDPNTAAREDLELEKDPNAGPGEREIQAINSERFGANQAGMLHSSFAQKNIGNALQRLSLEARQVVDQYSAQLTNVANQWSTSQQQLTTDWVNKYGEDSRWLADNPPPTPPDWTRSFSEIAGLNPGQASQVRLSYATAPDDSELAKMYPGFSFNTRRGVIENGVEGWITDAIRNGPDTTAAADGGPVNYAQQNRDKYHVEIGKNIGGNSRDAFNLTQQYAQQLGVRPEDIQLTKRKDGTWIAAVKKSAR